ncbi:MAG: NAD-dependent epimerase/dehydratase family protein [Myxococcota bacterium]
MSTAKKKPGRKKAGAVLVTGATGFLGKHLLDALRDPDQAGADANRPIRALVRTPTLHLERNGVDVTIGDVCRTGDCHAAMKDVTEVYHLAGRVSRDADSASGLYRVHVEGTRRVLEAAAAAGVKRVVLASTSGTIAVSESAEVSTEDSPYRTDVVRNWPYYLSKIYQEQTARKMAEELDLDLVIVNPSLLLGPGDERSSSTGDVEKVILGKLPVIPRGGGVAFVDARDAASGCLAAMKRGTAGERYLLNAENVTFADLMGRIARLADVTTPRAILEARTMRFAGRMIEAVWKQMDAKPPVDVEGLEMAEHYWYCAADKAKDELGWSHRDGQVTLTDTVRDVQRRHNRLPKSA